MAAAGSSQVGYEKTAPEPISILNAVAWIIVLTSAAWWVYVLVSFARAQALLARCEICVSPNWLETRDVFKAEGIYGATSNVGWLELIPASMLIIPASLIGIVLLLRGGDTRWRSLGLAVALANVFLPIGFMILARDQIQWISEFTD